MLHSFVIKMGASFVQKEVFVMRTTMYKRLQQSNVQLKKESLSNYRVLLGCICRDYRQYHPSIETLYTLLREDKVDWRLFYDIGSGLSSQKYDDRNVHFVANQISYLIKKYPFPAEVLDLKPRDTAIETFLKAERQCEDTNRYLKTQPFIGWAARAQDWIRRTIGDSPDLEAIYDLCGFGSGASIGVNGSATNIGRKICASEWTVTPGAYHFSLSAIRRHHQLGAALRLFNEDDNDEFRRYGIAQRFAASVKVIRHNKIAFVPKTTKTDRSIAVEPLLNGYLQKGVDEYLRLRLKRIGLDLRDQALNSELARVGSLGDHGDSFATIDLSSASDSLSIECARLLLPPAWFDFLNQIRSPLYELDGKVYRYSKFASMGNGFCFPLETLIFASICVACGANHAPYDYRVYGDDIIVRRSIAESVISALSTIGFRTNADKTFISGPFRESCGADWYSGVDVRPFTLDFALDSVQNIFKFCNLTQRSRLVSDFFWDLRPWALNLLPPELRFVRPLSGPADTAAQVEIDDFMLSPFARWNRKLFCWQWKELRMESCPDRFATRSRPERASQALVYAALLGVSSSMPFAMRRKTHISVRMVSYG